MTTTLKTCFKCDKEKPLPEFYKHPQMKDGRLNKCKACTKSDVKNNYAKNIDYYKLYERKRTHEPHRITGRGASVNGNLLCHIPNDHPAYAGKSVRSMSRIREPKKYKARNAVTSALKTGKLQKSPCFICEDSTKVHGHHVDYGKPLDVVWLCPRCHKRIHAYEDKSNEIKQAST